MYIILSWRNTLATLGVQFWFKRYFILLLKSGFEFLEWRLLENDGSVIIRHDEDFELISSVSAFN